MPHGKLKAKYAEIADLTLNHCKQTCPSLGSCCTSEYCEIAISFAKDIWDVELPTTDHPTLPLLGPDGKCTAAPHLRPMCALHSCDIASIGFFRGDKSRTKKYFRIRASIHRGEVRMMEQFVSELPASLLDK